MPCMAMYIIGDDPFTCILGGVHFCVRFVQFAQRANLGGWVGLKMFIVQIRHHAKYEHP